MFIKLSRAANHEDVIRDFRREICCRLGLNPSGPGIQPLPHAVYIFALMEGEARPAGMAEFFFYDDAFASYSASIYNHACDLSRIAPMHEMIHVRSVIIDPQHRNSKLFLHLSVSLITTAWDLGARYMTASTSTGYDYILGLHKTAGMTRLGTFVVDGEPQQLSLLELEPVAARAQRLRRRKTIYTDPSAGAVFDRRSSAFPQVLRPNGQGNELHSANV
jgi:hypothetical protein